MGYSERYCHICGVSFNMGRIRTQTEPRSHAWHEFRSRDRSCLTFVNGGRNSHIGDCERDAGCKLVFREDAMERLQRHQRERDHKNSVLSDDQDVNDQQDHPSDVDDSDSDFMPDPDIMEKLRTDDEFNTPVDTSILHKMIGSAHSIFRSTPSSLDDSISSVQNTINSHAILSNVDQTDSSMDYEYDSPAETCSDHSDDPENSLIDSSSTDTEDRNYRNFRRCFAQPNRVNSVPDIQEEIVLPLFRPLDIKDQDLASTDGSDASFECDEVQDGHEWNAAKLDHRISGKLSHSRHPLSAGMNRYDRDQVWEHVAGPGCLNMQGYNGARISEEEMRFANTLQCLVLKGDAGREGREEEVPLEADWNPEWDDEPWEGNAAWFLSGISDHMPSRDMDDPDVTPQRHGRKSINAENVCWGSDANDSDPRYAMPFHPACLEVFKRAAIRKHGLFNVDLLGSWWRLTSRYQVFHDFPRSEAVHRGEEQWWRHNPGDEHLGADPLSIPGLRDAILSAHAETAPFPGEDVQSLLSSLPPEISIQTLGDLEVVEVARTSLAVPVLRSVAKHIIQKKLREQYPTLWELGWTQPYYKWTGLTAWEIQNMEKDFDQREEEIHTVLRVLEEEGCNEAHDAFKQQWDRDLEGRKKTAFGSILRDKAALRIPDDEVGIARFVIALDEASKNDRLKGLQNRERIWKDCETILCQIEELQKQGDILANGQPRPGAKLYEHDQ